jgi:predicted HTH transcriptional regulator
MSTPTPPKKTRARKSKKQYFGPEVDVSIAKYNAATCTNEKSIIYQKEIQQPMEKLVENIIHTFKFYYTDNVPLHQVQHEVVSFLVEKLPKFDPSKGSKAFSYFSIVAKNYCILKNRKNYKKLVEHKRVDVDDNYELGEEETEDRVSLEEFFDKYLTYWDINIERYYPKKKDRIELFNKKALYVYIREMTDASTQQITKIVKQMKNGYKSMLSDYLELGYIPKEKTYTL